ncbi:MAG: CtsR family transcriptional regulator [Clostridia bacterium]|nr:CtsR family transcriptional regulator [Clostridia bacterium]
MNISDSIASMLMEMINRDGEAEIRRNEFADKLGCVPSQINYVITSRFTPEQGFIVTSRRGGGGDIRISRIDCEREHIIMHLVNSVGMSMEEQAAKVNILNLLRQEFISETDARMLLAAVDGRGYRSLPRDQADVVRAAIFKQMLLALN